MEKITVLGKLSDLTVMLLADLADWNQIFLADMKFIRLRL